MIFEPCSYSTIVNMTVELTKTATDIMTVQGMINDTIIFPRRDMAVFV
jgi:hypothetical protein